ncbi:unnamed protein product, partial [marine sediment metagenome]
RGYVARKLIRRAVRFGTQLSLSPGFTKDLAKVSVQIMKTAYPHFETQKETIFIELSAEEEKFRKTLDRGIREFEKITKDNVLSSKEAFLLYESYGFPVEITKELAEEKGVRIDLSDFDKEKKRHQSVSRKGLDKKFRGGLADTSEETVKLHTATHLLHQALRNQLGDHVQQKGSNITGERLRFDFSHPEKVTDEQIKAVEDKINEQVKKALPVTKETTTYEQAINQGALAFFGQRYPEKVDVYSIGNYSKEICGGPHVTNTKEIGSVTIIKESSAGAGIRRIYAIIK